ncbi:MAG: phenylalanine--tRNA ligase subunit beta [Helicobacteraceae bacterium]|jgi:phenylalanyl-tRNA synthetase beta chain|nr:phenylalanine--tRNA ligase subunit beta [Helicobacteraceae bacterium]
MIVAKSWLNEFISLEGLSDEAVSQTFERLGHEIASVRKITFDDNVVVGKIAICEKHPNADKLSLCEVDIGDKKLSIVCGAKNVKAGQSVLVAQIGAKLPDGLEIKEAELRGVKSYGMICSAKELGLGELNDGILALDDSVGELIAGAKLNDYPALADTIFEIDLTPNRGDCFSAIGLARELSAALNTPLNAARAARANENPNGIGRVLHLTSDPDATASVLIHAIENRGLKLPLAARLRLARSDISAATTIDALTTYVSLTTGVLFRAYDLAAIGDGELKAKLRVIKQDGLNLLIEEKGKTTLDTIGINFESKYAANDFSPLIVLEAFFAPPDEIAKTAFERKLKGDALFNRASKGSDPDLAMGARFFAELVARYSQSRFYSESLGYDPRLKKPMIAIDAKEVSDLIGRAIDKNEIIGILKRLGAEARSNGDQRSFFIVPPVWRHDLLNAADLTEEVVRVKGVDRVKPKPLRMHSKRSVTEGWRRFRLERNLANRAAAFGFNESMHFAFCDRRVAGQFGFKSVADDLNIANPISSNMNELRPTLLINLLEAAAKNRAKGASSVRLFEIGDIFGGKREQSREMAFVFSGKKESPSVRNHGKAENIDIVEFSRLIGGATIEFSLLPIESAYLQKGQAAQIVARGAAIGELGKLEPRLNRLFDLDAETFVARICLDKIAESAPKAKPFSKLQPIERDLSVVIDKAVTFNRVKSAIETIEIEELKRILAVDLYDDETLGDKRSLTLRLILQSFNKTPSEEDITKITDRVLARLKTDFGAVLR